MKTSKIFKLFLIGFTAIAFAACSGDDDDNPTPPVSDEEVITTLRLTFTDPEGIIAPQTFTYSDPDGPGGNAPVVDVISVQPLAYVVTIEVLDESNPNDVEDITEEIEEEDDEHQFFFVTNGSASDVLTITYADTDGNGNPVGLRTFWNVTDATEGAGSVTITLLHELNKTAEGIAIDNPSVAGGETDIEVQFQFVAQ